MVEMGQIKVFVQELWLKQEFLADTNMDYLTSEWPGTPNFKVDANFDMFPQNWLIYAFFVLFFGGKKCARAYFYTFRMSGSQATLK